MVSQTRGREDATVTSVSNDPFSVSRMLRDLQDDYPTWFFSVRYRGEVVHVEAVRSSDSTGTVCVVTDDTTELRSELDNAA